MSRRIYPNSFRERTSEGPFREKQSFTWATRLIRQIRDQRKAGEQGLDMKVAFMKNSMNVIMDYIFPDSGSFIRTFAVDLTTASQMGFSFFRKEELSSLKSSSLTRSRHFINWRISIFLCSLFSFLFGNLFPARSFAGMIQEFYFPFNLGSVQSHFMR